MSKAKLVRAEDATVDEHIFRTRHGRPPREGEVADPSHDELADAGYAAPRRTFAGWAEDDGRTVAALVAAGQLERVEQEIAALERLRLAGSSAVEPQIAELHTRAAELRRQVEEPAEEPRPRSRADRAQKRRDRARAATAAFRGAR